MPPDICQNSTLPGEHLSVISNTLLGDMGRISARDEAIVGMLEITSLVPFSAAC